MHRFFLILATTFALASPLAAAPSTELRLVLEPAETEISFVLEATGHKVLGSLELSSGELRFSPATGEASGEILIDAKSAETGSKGRDKNMHRKVLESHRYPQISFRIKSVQGNLAGELTTSGSLEIRVGGILSIHGGDHEIEVPVRLRRDGEGSEGFTAEAELDIPYVAWGMKDPSVVFLRVAKTVRVTVVARGRVDSPER